MTEVLTKTPSIRLKGRSFLALVLSPDLPFEEWLVRLDDLSSRSAGFFLRRPIVLDISDLDITREDLRGLIDQLKTRDVPIMGIEGARPSQMDADMPPAMTNGRPASDMEIPEQDACKEADEPPTAENGTPGPTALQASASTVVTQPVRSGQSQISDGDVTVVGSVASGAEVVAAVPFTSTARCAAGRKPVRQATRRRASSAASSRPNWSRSPATT
jgi:septum site-determining protein MinC